MKDARIGDKVNLNNLLFTSVFNRNAACVLTNDACNGMYRLSHGFKGKFWVKGFCTVTSAAGAAHGLGQSDAVIQKNISTTNPLPAVFYAIN